MDAPCGHRHVPAGEDRTLEEHQMHEEFVSITADTAPAMQQCERGGARIIAVGPPRCGALEGAFREILKCEIFLRC